MFFQNKVSLRRRPLFGCGVTKGNIRWPFVQLKQKSETSTSRRKFEVYTPQKHERHNDQRKEIGTHVLFVTYLPLQYRTPLIKNKKQKSWSRLDFIFENGCVLYTNFSKRHLPNFSCSRKSPPAFSCARFLPNRCPVLLLSTGWSIGFNFIVFNLRFFLKIRFVD